MSLLILLLLGFNLLALYPCQRCNRERDVVFLVDCSTSIQEATPGKFSSDNWSLLKDFLLQVIRRLPIEASQTRSTVLTFSTSVYLDSDSLFEKKDDLVRHVTNLPFRGGNTNTSGALRHARGLLGGPRKGLLVLLTDGMSNVDAALTLQEARHNKKLSITQLAVGVGAYVDENELHDLVNHPASFHYLQATNFSSLSLLVDQLVSKLACFRNPLPEPCRDNRADIMFVLDASGSIQVDQAPNQRHSNWFFMKKFFADVTSNLNVGPNATRIGLIKFSQEAEVVFHMNEYSDVDQLVDRISSISIIGSETNTSGALRLMNDQAFTPQHGDRPDVHNVAIVMTDGQSNVNMSGTVPEALRSKNKGVRMFVVGLTKNINANELRAMSSLPLEEHFFNRSTYSLVQSVVSSLVWNVCQGSCTNQSCVDSQRRCRSLRLSWRQEAGGLIVGHDYSRLSDIATPQECQRLCLQDPMCKSVEFVAAYSECSVSYYRRSDVPYSFKADSEVSYYEWFCS